MNLPAVTLFHGWGYTPALWQKLTMALPDFDCHAPRLLAPEAGIEEWADAQATSLPDHGLLVGWSLGAMLAYTIAARHPAKVRGLILLAGSPLMRNEAAWPNGLDADLLEKFSQGFRQAPERTMRRFLALQLVGDSHPLKARHLLEASLDDVARHHDALEHGLRILFSTDLRDTALPPGLPLRLIHGRRDEVMPVAGSEWLHRRYPDSRLLILEEAGHAPLLAEPEILATHIRALHDAA